MNPISLLLRLPLLPLQGVIWLGETLRDQAEQELYDPLAVRRELEEAADAAASGQRSPMSWPGSRTRWWAGWSIALRPGPRRPAPSDQYRR